MTIVKLKEEVEIICIIANVLAEQFNVPMVTAHVDAKKIVEALETKGYAIGSFR